MICERCGHDIHVPDYPFCKGRPEDHRQGGYGIITDDIPGGFVQEHFGHSPETFYSKKHMLKRADDLGLQPMVRWVPGDKHLTNWGASIDPYTLAAAAELVSRRALRNRAEPVDEIICESAKITVEAK